jgi:DNA-binding transcriptional MerR regulator
MSDSFANRSFLLAGELAGAVGVSTDTLRHYERKGVLPRPRRGANGYRLYPAESLARLLTIRRALAVGFTLDELARILSERDKGGAPCREVRKLAGEKLAEIEEQLKTQMALRDELRAVISEWDERLSNTGPGVKAGLLESLPNGKSSKNDRSKLPLSLKTKKGR